MGYRALALFVTMSVAVVGAQVDGKKDPSRSPSINLSEDALLITDFPRSRLYRVKDLSDSGWEAGPTLGGQAYRIAYKLALDSLGRIYVADSNNVRIVRTDDVAGNGWTPFTGAGSNRLAVTPTIFSTRENNYYSDSGVWAVAFDSSGRMYVGAANPMRLVRVDDLQGNGWTEFQLPGANCFSIGKLSSTSKIAFTSPITRRIASFGSMTCRGRDSSPSERSGVASASSMSPRVWRSTQRVASIFQMSTITVSFASTI